MKKSPRLYVDPVLFESDVTLSTSNRQSSSSSSSSKMSSEDSRKAGRDEGNGMSASGQGGYFSCPYFTGIDTVRSGRPLKHPSDSFNDELQQLHFPLL